MDTATTIRTRRDGSIDTGHYMRLGRLARSAALHDMIGTARTPKRRGHSGLIAACLALFGLPTMR